MTLPVLISVPHAGLRVPPEVQEICLLTEKEIAEDGDEGAAEIYYPLKDQVAVLVTTHVARAVVDINRAEDDRRKDGIIKTHTCWDVPIYNTFPSETLIETLLEQYYRPYHRQLTAGAQRVLLGIDCHTMAAQGPPVGPDPEKARPHVCLSNADGTCPTGWMEIFSDCFAEAFDGAVSVNSPFKGGYITRTHACEIPWIQLELSRAPFLSDADKALMVNKALHEAVGLLN